MALSAVSLLVPSEASKVVCIGQNYRKHAEEMGKPVPAEPLIFMKPSTALNAHRSPIQIPKASQEVHYEAELGLLIGERLKNADEATAARAIWGLTCINDVTARDIQRREVQHTARAKPSRQQVHESRLNDAPLVMALFRPGIGKEHQHAR